MKRLSRFKISGSGINPLTLESPVDEKCKESLLRKRPARSGSSIVALLRYRSQPRRLNRQGCKRQRHETPGRIVGGDALIAPSVLLNEIGTIAEKYINNIDTKLDDGHVGQYVIMSDRIHMIIALKNGAMWTSPPTEGIAGIDPYGGNGGASPPMDARIPKITGSLKTMQQKKAMHRSYSQMNNGPPILPRVC